MFLPIPLYSILLQLQLGVVSRGTLPCQLHEALLESRSKAWKQIPNLSLGCPITAFPAPQPPPAGAWQKPPHTSPPGLPEGTAQTVSDWELFQPHLLGSEGKCLSELQVSCRWGRRSRLCLTRTKRKSRDGAGAAPVSAEGGAELPGHVWCCLHPTSAAQPGWFYYWALVGRERNPGSWGGCRKRHRGKEPSWKSDPRTAQMWHLPLALNHKNSSREQSWFPERLTMAFVSFCSLLKA